MKPINVLKRNGTKVPLDIERIHRVVSWACAGLENVSVSDVEIKARLAFFDGIKTEDIQETLIRSAGELISVDAPDYRLVAGRLMNYDLRKKVFGKYEPDALYEHVNRVTKLGFYDKELLMAYSREEWDDMNAYLDHERDFLIDLAGMNQFRTKYVTQNRVTKQVFETPQIAFMLIGASVFSKRYSGQERMKIVKEFYDEVSTFRLSLPSPIMAGLRTPQRQFSSCVLIETDDSLDSIGATGVAILKYVSQKAGIGVNLGRIRAIGSPVRNGDTEHTGLFPFVRKLAADVKSCSQGSLRNGAGTFYFPCWHYEIEDILVWKNNKGTESNRERRVDYGIQFNELMYKRLIQGGNITLFSPHDVPDLYDAFFADNGLFEELYEKYEKSKKIRKKSIPASELFSKFMTERFETGRIYLMNVDHCNTHSSFYHDNSIRQSNLCCEITLPTNPISLDHPEQGLVALCTLSAINFGKFKKPEDMRQTCRIAVEALDALLDYQEYPINEARRHTELYRPLGIGPTNIAYWLAKNKIKYSDPNLDFVHEWAEAYSYYLIEASVDLARRFGSCEANTKYRYAHLPIDTYKKEVDELVSPDYKLDWNIIRERLREYGIRNSTLMAGMPCESSSLTSNSTNGFEPVRDLTPSKGSKDGVPKQVVPEAKKLEKWYDLLWEQRSPEGYLNVLAVFQKFMDQAISVNTSYNPEHHEGGKISIEWMIGHLLHHYKYGGKTLYYCNSADGAGEVEDKALPTVIEDEGDCSSCKI